MYNRVLLVDSRCIVAVGVSSLRYYVSYGYVWFVLEGVMARHTSDVDMGRVTIMLPVETIAQISDWAAAAGFKRGQFTSVALVIGSRILARQLAPESFMTSEAWKSLAEAMGVNVAAITAGVAGAAGVDGSRVKLT